MTAARQREIRQAGFWHYTGSEPAGERPALVVSANWFNHRHAPLVIPLTSRIPGDAYPWEVCISDGDADSWAPVPGLKTVPNNLLSRSVRGFANASDFGCIVDALWQLIDGRTGIEPACCQRGQVWSVNISRVGSADTEPNLAYFLVLRYNHANGMAMTVRLTDRPFRPSVLALPVRSCQDLAGYTVLVGQVRPLSFHERFVSCRGTLADAEVNQAARSLINLVKSDGSDAA